MNEFKKKEKSGSNRTQRVARSVTGVIGGTFLTREDVTRQLPFLIFIVVLALVYISNSYSSEKLALTIERVKKENEVLRYEHISMKSQLMDYSRQSEVAKKLKGTGLKESTTPPHKIFYKP
jgi:hypothetical protein